MGRPRKKNKHLPQNVQPKHGAYYYVRANKWTPLGKTLPKMYRALAELLDENPLQTVADLCDQYGVKVIPTKDEHTQKTHGLYLRRFRTACGHMRIKTVRPCDIQAVVDVRAEAHPTTANRELELYKHLFKKAVSWGARNDNPARELEGLKLAKRDRYVTDAELDAVYALASPMMQVAIDLAVLTGQRRSDLLTLTRDDLTDEGIAFQPSKTVKTTGTKLIVEWSNELRAAINRAKSLPPQVRRHIIANRRGKPYTRAGFNSNWQRLIAKAVGQGIEHFRFNDLRAKSASDDDLDRASDRLGHASRATTKRFYRRRPELVKPLR